MSSFRLSKLSRCVQAQRAYVIEFEAYDMFALMTYLRENLPGEQLSKSRQIGTDGKDTRPWFFVFVNDSTSPHSTSSDGTMKLRLYVNDTSVIESMDYQFSGNERYVNVNL